VVELTLELFQSRTKAAGFPAAMGASAKIDTGRFIHVQDTGFHHGRAILVVREVKPSGFAQNLELKRLAGGSGALQLFPTEAHSPGEAATALPAAFTPAQLSGAPQVAGSKGMALFVEGHTVSGGLRDVVLQLGIQGDEPDGDRSAFTVVQLSNLRAVVPSTQSPRSGAVPDHPAFIVGNPPAAGHFDEDFAVNAPLVLLENSVSAAAPVRLSVQVNPAGVPISWSALRDRRPVPDGDGSGVLAASPRVEPTVTRTGAGLTADLQTNAVGSFHVRAFVNNNGTPGFDRDPTKAISFAPDPFILMNLVLVRVTLDSDDVQVHQTLVGATDGAGGIQTSSGPNPFNINTPNLHAIHQNALCTLIGGGRKGRLGVDSIFAGWINNMTADLTWRGTFRDPANPPDNISAHHFATNGPPPHVFLPPPPPAGVGPAIPAIPPLILDTGRGGGGTGGDSACLGRSRIRGARDNTLALGQRIRVEAVDAPGVGMEGAHPAFPAANMIRFDFALRFRSFLSFWANNGTPPSSARTGDTAERLYNVLLEAPWTMDGSWDVNPGTGAVTVHTAGAVGLPGNVKHSPAVSAATTAVEVRAPRALDMIVTDAQR
jgi:hypothetical protein